jgi:hypothetical protein
MKLLIALAAVLPAALGFYLPGVAPSTFEDGAEVKLKVNKVRPRFFFFFFFFFFFLVFFFFFFFFFAPARFFYFFILCVCVSPFKIFLGVICKFFSRIFFL